MRKIVLFVLFLLSFSVMALDLTEDKIIGKWHIETIVMGTLGELPAGENDFFNFEKGIFTSAAQGESSQAPYELEENRIIVTHPNKIEVFTVTKLTEEQMTFFVDVFVNGKKMSAGNISFKLRR